MVDFQPLSGYNSSMYQRNLITNLQAALSDTPVVLINGARQTGKSTLTKSLPEHAANYYSLDNATVLNLALADPDGFIQSMPDHVILDEIQHIKDLFRAIKLAVDEKRTPGRFLLTGSANVLLLPQLSESLAGRIEILTLWPLSQGEIHGVKETIIDQLFNYHPFTVTKTSFDRQSIIDIITTGGYPEIVDRKTPDRRRAWFDSYITTILQRDVRDIANIEGLTELPRLLTLLAARAATLLNFAELGRTTGIAQTTLKRYMTLLEITFLIQYLPAWASNHSKRLVKSPKVLLNDTGLLSHLLGIDAQRFMVEPHLLGKILENFVAMELYKQATWSKTKPQLFHYRTQAGQKVDVLLENAAGEIVGIEVKASNSVATQDFKGLQDLAETTGKKFIAGAVLYLGQNVLPFGKNMYALPVSSLWELHSII